MSIFVIVGLLLVAIVLFVLGMRGHHTHPLHGILSVATSVIIFLCLAWLFLYAKDPLILSHVDAYCHSQHQTDIDKTYESYVSGRISFRCYDAQGIVHSYTANQAIFLEK